MLCQRDTHHWRLLCVLVMGIADADGWYPVVVQRRCTVCLGWDEWRGEQSTTLQQIRLLKEP